MTTAMQQIKKLSDKTTLAALFFVFCAAWRQAYQAVILLGNPWGIPKYTI